MNMVFTKLPNQVRLEWKRYALEKTIIEPFLYALADWLLNNAKARQDLPANSNLPLAQHILVHEMRWKMSHSTRNNDNAI